MTQTRSRTTAARSAATTTKSALSRNVRPLIQVPKDFFKFRRVQGRRISARQHGAAMPPIRKGLQPPLELGQGDCTIWATQIETFFDDSTMQRRRGKEHLEVVNSRSIRDRKSDSKKILRELWAQAFNTPAPAAPVAAAVQHQANQTAGPNPTITTNTGAAAGDTDVEEAEEIGEEEEVQAEEDEMEA